MTATNFLRRNALRLGFRVVPPGSRLHPVLVRASRRTDLHRVGDVRVKTSNGAIRLRDPAAWEVARTLYWFGRQGFEPETLMLFEALAGRACVLLDIGANVGYYGLLAARLNPKITVCAFEPAPATYNQLVRNIAINGLPNVLPYQCAVGERCGTARLYLSDNDCSASVLAGFRTPVNRVDIPVTTVDQFVVDHEIQRVDLIKLDVEGFEDKVVQGAVRVIRRDRPMILCEVLAGRSETALHSLLDPLAYHYSMIVNNGLLPRNRICGDPSYSNRNYLFSPHHPASDDLLRPRLPA